MSTALQLLSRVTAPRPSSASLLATVLFLTIYSTYAIEQLVGPRPLLVLLVAGSLLLLGLLGDLPRTAARLGVAVGVAAPLAYAVIAATLDLDKGGAKTVTYVTLLVPAAILGALARMACGTRSFARTYVYVSLAVSVVAFYEVLRRSTLLPHPELAGFQFRNGQLRAVAGADHPLVLGTMLAVAAVVSVLVLRRVPAVLACLVLLGGVFCTVSRGAVVVAVAGLALAVLVRWRRPLMSPWTARTLAVISLPLLVAAFITQISVSGTVDSTNLVEASAQYRSAILYAIPSQLAEAPFGRGPGGLPYGAVQFPTKFGPVDLSLSVDSEIGLLAFEFGFLGLVAFAALWVLCLSQVLQRNPWALPALVIAGAGFSVGIQAFTSLALVWMLTIGTAVASAFERRDADHGRDGAVP